MLVLSRKAQQTIRIGSEITVSVIRVRGNKVQLGIEAPAHIHILRSELEQRTADAKPLLAEIDAAPASPTQDFPALDFPASSNPVPRASDHNSDAGGATPESSNQDDRPDCQAPVGFQTVAACGAELATHLSRGLFPSELESMEFDSPLQQFLFCP